MIQNFFDKSFSVYSVQNSYDSGGALVKDTVLKSANNKCKLDMLTGNKIVYNEKKELVADFLLFCLNLDVSVNDIINIDNENYEVKVIDTTTLRGKEPHLEIYLLKQS